MKEEDNLNTHVQTNQDGNHYTPTCTEMQITWLKAL